jgi:hypothetical protein
MKRHNDSKKFALSALAIALFAFAGCSDQSAHLAPEPPRCELNTNAVCASAMENYLTAEAVWPARVPPPTSPHLVPLVAPLRSPGGQLDAEVDCYVNVDPDGSWLVYAHVAILPKSLQATEHLRNQDLCTDQLPESKLAMESTPYNP